MVLRSCKIDMLLYKLHNHRVAELHNVGVAYLGMQPTRAHERVTVTPGGLAG
jgi:hypothetical protein